MRKGCFLLLCLLTACSGSKMMDNKTATERVEYYLKYQHSSIVVEIGRVAKDCGTKLYEGQEASLGVDPSSDVSILVNQAAGYISVVPDGPDFWKIELTEKGKAAVIGNPFPEPPLKGCDFHNVRLIVGTPELVRVTGVTADERNPEVEYLWKWNLTELGKELREGGKANAILKPDQRDLLSKYGISGVRSMPIPAPPEETVQKDVMKFERFTDGWRLKRERK
jgi:hypothetical protein